MTDAGKVLILISEKKEVLFFHAFFREHFPGYRLLFPPPGEENLAVCAEEQPDLVVLDVFSTGTYGLDMCRQIRKDPLLRMTPILAVTRQSPDSALSVSALEAGADACISHPTKEKGLHIWIRLLLRMKRLADAASPASESMIVRLRECESEAEKAKADQKRAEENILVEREFARQVMNAMGQGLTITNSDGLFQYVNRAYASMLGYSPEEMLGRAPLEFTHPDDAEILAAARNLRLGGESNTYECRLVSVKGQIIPVMVSGVPYFRAGRMAGTIAVITDITELKEKECKLKRLSEDYERVFHGSREALFLVEVKAGNQFRFVRTNPTHQQLTGISLEEIAGKTPVELLGKTLGTRIQENYERCVSNKKTITYEEEISLPGGMRRWETSLTPVLENGKVVFIVGSGTDTTRFKKQEVGPGEIKNPSGMEGSKGG